MKILVVEDDDHKRGVLTDFVKEQIGDAELFEARAYQTGLRDALSLCPDLIFLDMSMPNYALTDSEHGGRPKAFAGREIIRELRRKSIKSLVIVVTQFETFGEGREKITLSQLREQLAAAFPQGYVGTVYYHPSESKWRQELKQLIQKAIRSIK